MKHSKNLGKCPKRRSIRSVVPFEFNHQVTKTLDVARNINHWLCKAKTLRPASYGHWLKEKDLSPGRFEYCIVGVGQ